MSKPNKFQAKIAELEKEVSDRLSEIQLLQADEEKALIDTLAGRLEIASPEAGRIIEAAESRARRLLAVL